ncbi:hypothetical protein HMPREF0971_03281 [Segatella oris F0302]|uniref:Uncharacterized protein n=1 Tax=Segatella oris F0302 TaxID=649760 RepID=D1QW86_9BACT|nr:hypothetical protein [Segatella oris]EFB30426.1 hypothetical protein HMPREF0971_03281 [Segatella oris F0302]
MELHIEKCIDKYKELFSPENNSCGFSTQPNTEKEIFAKEKYKEFERIFFIEMNNALFVGEYLEDGYTEKIEEFENILLNNDSKFSPYIRDALKGLRGVLFRIQTDNRTLQVNLTKNDSAVASLLEDFQFYNAWHTISLNLLYIDHTLINERKYREKLIKLYYEIEATIIGLDNEDLLQVFQKLKSKCSFLLGKTFVFDNKEKYYYSVDFEIKKVKEIIKGDIFNKKFSFLFSKMYPSCKYGQEIVSKYQREFSVKNFSSIGFVILAYYYDTSQRKSVQRLKNLLEDFQEYEESMRKKDLSKFDSDAILSIKSYISNCRFSLSLKQQNYTIDSLKVDIAEIEAIQEETGITNYHPYKKALSFLGKYMENLREDESKQLQNGLELYNNLYKKYKSTYEECILRRFTPFQLLKDDCKTDDTIFFASSFSKPISPSKLEDDERKYRDLMLYLRMKERLAKREAEITNVANSVRDFRRQSFEYLGIFITIITFLFGSIQLFGNKEITPKASIINIVSLGIVLAIFMAMLYIILYSKRCKILALFIFVIFSFAALIIYTNYIPK